MISGLLDLRTSVNESGVTFLLGILISLFLEELTDQRLAVDSIFCPAQANRDYPENELTVVAKGL